MKNWPFDSVNLIWLSYISVCMCVVYFCYLFNWKFQEYRHRFIRRLTQTQNYQTCVGLLCSKCQNLKGLFSAGIINWNYFLPVKTSVVNSRFDVGAGNWNVSKRVIWQIHFRIGRGRYRIFKYTNSQLIVYKIHDAKKEVLHCFIIIFQYVFSLHCRYIHRNKICHCEFLWKHIIHESNTVDFNLLCQFPKTLKHLG